MAVTILIPTALRVFTGRKAEYETCAASVGEAAANLAAAFPDIKKHIYNDDGNGLRSFINVFVGETNIKKLDGLETKIKDGDTVMLVPAIAGGKR
jgi:adenylyltransferase/sulfurtransferase